MLHFSETEKRGHKRRGRGMHGQFHGKHTGRKNMHENGRMFEGRPEHMGTAQASTISAGEADVCPLCKNHCSASNPGCPKGEAFFYSSGAWNAHGKEQ